MLSFKNVTVILGRKAIINSANLEVESGEIVRICGASGSGKSVLLRCAAGLVRYSGEIQVDGADLKSRTARAATVHLDDPLSGCNVHRSMTVIEHLRAVSLLRGKSGETVSDALKILAGLGLNDISDAALSCLSAVELRKVRIAEALAQGPKLLLLDRPLLGMSKLESDEIVANLLALKAKGCAILIATSEADELSSGVADRLIQLRDGNFSSIDVKSEPDDNGDIATEYTDNSKHIVTDIETVSNDDRDDERDNIDIEATDDVTV